MDRNPAVAAWVKNDHFGFEVLYVYRCEVRHYRPDCTIRLRTGDILMLGTKGQRSEPDRAKRRFLDEWVRAGNARRGFVARRWDVSRRPGDVKDILLRRQ